MWRDLGVTAALREFLPEWTVPVFGGITVLGSLEFIIGVLAVLYLAHLIFDYREHGHLESRPRTIFIIAAVFGGLTAIVCLKASFGLPRPPSDLMAIERSGFGFPSGHTMGATVLWGGLALWTRVLTRRVRFAVAGMVIGLVGLSRMALGVHYAVDIVASIGLGVGYLLVVHQVGRLSPRRAFGMAFGIVAVTLIVVGPVADAVLASVGTLGAFFGWRLVDALGDRLTPRDRSVGNIQTGP